MISGVWIKPYIYYASFLPIESSSLTHTRNKYCCSSKLSKVIKKHSKLQNKTRTQDYPRWQYQPPHRCNINPKEPPTWTPKHRIYNTISIQTSDSKSPIKTINKIPSPHKTFFFFLLVRLVWKFFFFFFIKLSSS